MLPAHLYVHVPFCARRCSYCDFSIAVRSTTPVDEFVQGIRQELDHKSIEAATLDTIYLGGGTPSRLGGPGVAGVLDAVREHARIATGAEITIEANPDDVNDVAVAQWANAGVNRVSLGAQSFDDSVLKWMHRTHDAAQIGRAVTTLRRGGIENLSLDLIFALPAHLARSWKSDIEHALALNPAHISLYGLTVESSTPISRWRDRGEVVEGSEDSYEEEFLCAHERVSSEGFDHYEVSNFGLPGFHSRHNSAYWTGAPYAGIGPSAHAFDGERRRWNVSAYSEWIRCLNAAKTPVAGDEFLTAADREAEDIYLGLRTTRGLGLRDAEIPIAGRWAAAGWAELDDQQIRLTPTGWLRLDSLAADLAARRVATGPSAIGATPSHCYI